MRKARTSRKPRKPMYTNYARFFCKETTGHDKTWPWWANDECPVCHKEFTLEDALLVVEEENAEYTVYHYDCYRGRKPPFQWYAVT